MLLLAILSCIPIKPGLHIVGKIVSMCLRPCPKEHTTAPQVLIAKISCERFKLYNVCSVHRGMFSTSEGYHEYIRGCSVHWGDTMSTLADV